MLYARDPKVKAYDNPRAARIYTYSYMKPLRSCCYYVDRLKDSGNRKQNWRQDIPKVNQLPERGTLGLAIEGRPLKIPMSMGPKFTLL